jgi:hypothetical protein
VVAVVSRGDPELVELDGRTGWHFPQADDGTYAGFHPANGTEALRHLREVVGRGATHFVVPATSGWWLDYYAELAAHLEADHELVARGPTHTVYRLRGDGGSGQLPAVETPAAVSSNGSHPAEPSPVPSVEVVDVGGGATGLPPIEIRILVGRSPS